MSNHPKQLSNAYVSVLKLNSTGPIEALAVVQLDSTGGIVSGGVGGGSTQVSVREILTSSGASVMDSTEGAIKVNVVAGAAGGSTYVSVRQSTATDLNAAVVQGSTVWQTQVSSLAGRVLIAAFHGVAGAVNVADSTNSALRVNVVAGAAGGSTDVSVTQMRDSSGGSVSAGDSENQAIRVNVVAGAAGGSTTITVRQSTASDLNVAAVQGSTVWQVQVSSLAGQVQSRVLTSSGGAVEGSTTTPSTGSVLGLNVRVVQPSGRQSTTLLVTSSNSTATYTLASSAAGLKQLVYAFSITSTVITPSTFVFTSVGSSDNANADRWAVVLGTGSSGITGANLATAPPGFLFGSDAANGLKLRIENAASTQTVARVSLAWFSEE